MKQNSPPFYASGCMKRNDIMAKPEKTNVMRLLEQSGVEYKSYCYIDYPSTKGTEIAAYLKQDPAKVFKTLVTRGKSGGYYVFVIPVGEELELRKAAQAAGEKSIEMIPQKELLPLTGYLHGGCSPIGMKKMFPTFIEETAMLYDTIIFSAGKIGYQVEVDPEALSIMVPFTYADLVN